VCMKFAINARFLTQRITGVQRYARELTGEIISAMGQDRVILFSPEGAPTEFMGVPVKQTGLSVRGHAWEQLVLPYMVKRAGVDMLLSPGNIGPMLVGRQVLTIHDAAVFAHPKGFNRVFSRWYSIALPLLAKRVRKIITDSDFSRRELLSYLNVDHQKVSVIPIGVSSIFERLSLSVVQNFKRSNNLPERFILALGSKGYNKNHKRLLEAWEILVQKRDYEDLWLITVGGRVGTLVGDYASVSSQYPRVMDLGYVADEQLPFLYNAAEAFVFPSLYEGFGLPPLEAMACGCPVVVSGIASLPEVCGDAALYCDPYNPQDIAGRIDELLSNKEIRQKQRYRGIEQSKKFTWSRCARETLSVIEKVLEK